MTAIVNSDYTVAAVAFDEDTTPARILLFPQSVKFLAYDMPVVEAYGMYACRYYDALRNVMQMCTSDVYTLKLRESEVQALGL